MGSTIDAAEKRKKQRMTKVDQLVAAGFTLDQAEVLVEMFTAKVHKKTASETSQVWDAYEEEYNKRYRSKPVRNATVNSQIKAMVARIGKDAVEVVKFYVRHNDSFYVRKCHPIGMCLKDAESLYTQWVRNVTITGNDARQVENAEHYSSQMDRIKRGEL